jgi:putative restriction endonuclease
MHPRPGCFARMRFAYPGYALMTFSDDFRIMLSPNGVPDDLDKLIRPDRMLAVPAAPELRPHPTYLSWHREHCFKR